MRYVLLWIFWFMAAGLFVLAVNLSSWTVAVLALGAYLLLVYTSFSETPAKRVSRHLLRYRAKDGTIVTEYPADTSAKFPDLKL